MNNRLCIFVCDNFAKEVKQVVLDEGHEGVEIMPLEVHCMGPLMEFSDLEAKLIECSDSFHKIVFFGSSCLMGMDQKTLSNSNIEYIPLKNCFDLLMPSSLVDHFLQEQNYFVSEGWFDNYEMNIQNWGFEPEVARKFFSETSKNILYIDTSEGKKIPLELDKLSQYMGLPTKVIPVGTDFLRERINSVVLKWQVECEQENLTFELATANKKNADYSMIFHQIEALLGLSDRETLLQKVFTFLEMMFAPRDIAYIPFDEGSRNWIWFKGNDAEELKTSGKFFPIPVEFGGEDLGTFSIYEVKFPEHIERYKSIFDVALAMMGLAFSNVRKFEIIKANQALLNEQALLLKDHILVKDRFFSIIAHDLRSPFNSILGLSKVLEEDYNELDDSYKLAMLRKINQSAGNYFQLLENLLEWASSQTGRMSFRPEKTNFHAIVTNCIDLFDSSCRLKGIRIRSKIDEESWVFGDRNMMTTIVRNILSNAIKFTPSGGTVTIQPKFLDGDKGDFIRFCIEDSGVGIHPDQVSKLFNQGEKVHTKGTENEPGSGLGLLLVSEMVEYHKGTIVVQSVPGQGSCFSFSLPIDKFDELID